MHKAILCIGFLPLVLAIGDVVQVRPCRGNQPVPREVRVADCPSVPCPMRRGRDANVEVDFRALYSTPTLKTQVVPIAMGLELPYDVTAEHARACDWLVDSSCPISEGDDVTYNLKIPVKKNYPKIGLNVEISLLDDKNRIMFCFVSSMRVV